MSPLPTPCPKCNANPGDPCKTINGHDTTAHTARVQAFIQNHRRAA